MIDFRVRAWSAWAPGLQRSEDWTQWARAPAPPRLDGHPELKFVPAMQRRRFSRLSKMALQVAFDATPPELLSDVCTVFASRHGEANACAALLADIARGQPLSPTAFSHSVHNTQGGLFSIAAQNPSTSSAIAAGTDTFCAGLVEALGLCERNAGGPVLLVVADEPMPEIFSGFQDELPCAYSLALLLELGAAGGGRAFRVETSIPTAETRAGGPRLPQALEFLAWMLAGEEELALPCGARGSRFRRARA